MRSLDPLVRSDAMAFCDNLFDVLMVMLGDGVDGTLHVCKCVGRDYWIQMDLKTGRISAIWDFVEGDRGISLGWTRADGKDSDAREWDVNSIPIQIF